MISCHNFTTNRSLRVVGKDFRAPSDQGIRNDLVVLVERYGTEMMLSAIERLAYLVALSTWTCESHETL